MTAGGDAQPHELVAHGGNALFRQALVVVAVAGAIQAVGMTAQPDLQHLHAFGLDLLHELLELNDRVGTHVLHIEPVEVEEHVGGERHDRRRGWRSRRSKRSRGSRCGRQSQRRAFVQQAFGDLHIRLGVPPLLLVELVSGVRELDLGAGDLGCRAREAAMAADVREAIPSTSLRRRSRKAKTLPVIPPYS
jgi:hypothetical protein